MRSLAAALLLFAQVEMPRVDEIVEVRLINFDVVVTDAAGNHVTGLAREDFEVYEDGKRVEITNFSAFTAAQQKGTEDATRAAQVVIFVDVVTTSTFERKRACAALAQFVDTLDPGDHVMIASWNRALRLSVPPTTDRAALKRGLDVLAREMSLLSPESRLRQEARPSSPAEKRMVARMQARATLADLQQSAAAVNAVLTRMAGVEGRKVMLLVTKGFAARLQEDVEDLSSEDLDAAAIVKRIARVANAAGVTLYGVHAGGVESGMDVEDSDASAAIARGRRSGASVDGLRHLASRTGGLVAANTNTFRQALDRIRDDLSSYYSIAYRAETRRATGQKDVVIRTRNKNYRVRARRELVERTFDEEIADRVVATLFFPVTHNDLKISTEIRSAERQKKFQYAVALDVHIPYELLSFTPDGDSLVADVSLYIGAADERDGMSDVKRFDQKIRIPRDRLAGISRERYTYGFDVDLRTIPGDHRIAIAAIDNLSKVTGYAAVDLGKLPKK